MGTYYFNLPLKGLINLENETWLQLSLRLELFTQTRKHVPSDWDCTHKRMQCKNLLTNLGRSPLAVANGWSRVKQRMTWNHIGFMHDKRDTQYVKVCKIVVSMGENGLAKVVWPLHCNSWKLAFHQIKVASMFIHFETFMAAVHSCKVPTSNSYVIVSSSGMPCWKKSTRPKKRRRSISFWACLLYLDPPFGCQMSGQKGPFLVGDLWGPNFRPNWRIQALSLHYYQGCKVSAFSRQTDLSSCTDFTLIDFHGFLRIFMDFNGFSRTSMD